ncbi:MAG TPA: hypothetical protein VFI39_04365 [Gemmatimonadales bacterium]|nr:hypothetical protein [Gemmatimonadales bacterium]
MASLTSPTQLRIVHWVLITSSVVITAVVWGVRSMPGAAPPATIATASILYVGIAVGILALTIGMATWRTIAPWQPPVELREWLRSAGPRMIVTWGLCEGAAVVGGITYFTTGNAWACGVLSGAAILAVIYHSPGRLASA